MKNPLRFKSTQLTKMVGLKKKHPPTEVILHKRPVPQQLILDIQPRTHSILFLIV